VFDALSARNSLKNHPFFILPVWRNQNHDRLADGFVGRVAEQSLRSLIPTCNDATEVLTYDCVITGLDNGCEPPNALLAFA